MFEIKKDSADNQQSMYSKYLNLLSLVYDMQSSNDGIGYEHIQSKYEVSRRTAERMMRAILESNSDVEVIRHRPKRWRIKKAIEAPSPTLEHLAMLKSAVKIFKQHGMDDYAKNARNLSKYLKVNMEHNSLTRIDPDLEALEDAEVFSHRPGPAQILEAGVLEGLQLAIKGSNKVSFDYKSANGKTKRWFYLHPYGFVHGNHTRSYLLALNAVPSINDLRMFTLTNISKLEVYKDQYFERNPEHSVEDYLKDCFGVFKERRKYNVVWRFDAKHADVIQDWIFHPSQQIKVLDDGRIEVSFKACGLREMAWHVVTWGDLIEVVKPKVLINELRAVKNAIRVPD